MTVRISALFSLTHSHILSKNVGSSGGSVGSSGISCTTSVLLSVASSAFAVYGVPTANTQIIAQMISASAAHKILPQRCLFDFIIAEYLLYDVVPFKQLGELFFKLRKFFFKCALTCFQVINFFFGFKHFCKSVSAGLTITSPLFSRCV